MTHPHQLHAHTAAWSLRAARGHLHQAAVEHARIVPDVTHDCLRSTVYGTRGAGGHGDPTANFLMAAIRPNRAAELAERTTATLEWLAKRLNAPGAGDPLGRLHTALPTLSPATADYLHLWLTEADQKIRTMLSLNADQQLLVGKACPACGTRQLYAQTSAPDPTQRTIICTADCHCTGNDCTCGMPIRATGVAHIWESTSLLASYAGGHGPGL